MGRSADAHQATDHDYRRDRQRRNVSCLSDDATSATGMDFDVTGGQLA
jgi:hypothetical protein